MSRMNQIALMTIDIDTKQLQKVANEGRLEEFVQEATRLFQEELMGKAIAANASASGSALFDDGKRFGTGPWPFPPRRLVVERLFNMEAEREL